MYISNKYTWYPFKLVHSKQIDSLINFCSNMIKPSRLINSDTQRQASHVYSKLIAPLYLSLPIYDTLWYILTLIYISFLDISNIWKIDFSVVIYSFVLSFIIKSKLLKRILLIFKISYFNDNLKIYINWYSITKIYLSVKIFYILFPNIHFKKVPSKKKKAYKFINLRSSN